MLKWIKCIIIKVKVCALNNIFLWMPNECMRTWLDSVTRLELDLISWPEMRRRTFCWEHPWSRMSSLLAPFGWCVALVPKVNGSLYWWWFVIIALMRKVLNIWWHMPLFLIYYFHRLILTRVHFLHTVILLGAAWWSGRDVVWRLVCFGSALTWLWLGLKSAEDLRHSPHGDRQCGH